MLLTTVAIAVVNKGRWVAECPRAHCSNAIKLEPKQSLFHCGGEDGCRLTAEVLWPANADEIWDVLLRRPIPGTRNWAPAGHRQALVDGFPNGQSVAELLEEQRQHESNGGQ